LEDRPANTSVATIARPIELQNQTPFLDTLEGQLSAFRFKSRLIPKPIATLIR